MWSATNGDQGVKTATILAGRCRHIRYYLPGLKRSIVECVTGNAGVQMISRTQLERDSASRAVSQGQPEARKTFSTRRNLYRPAGSRAPVSEPETNRGGRSQTHEKSK